MKSKLLVKFGLTSACLAVTLGIVMSACGGDAEGPVPAPPMLATSPTTVVVHADTPESPAVRDAATPASSAGPLAESINGVGAEPSGPLSNQVVSSTSYWPGWSNIDCATYTRRPAAFCEAMKDAEVAEPSEISANLLAITGHDKELVWSGTRAESRLLVLTWSAFIDRTSPQDPYDPGNGFRVGESMVSTRDVFVTVVPELREFCRESGPFVNEALRMEQLLGLAPNDGKDGRGNEREFVELWVDQQFLFRPSPDPEISDGEAELDFPQSERFLSVSADHIQWFRNFKSMSYEETGLPWTRLGYTYDWGSLDSEVGLSEFVIKGGATVEVLSITPTEEYC
ncbi:MAG TPA: hypothetical protein VFA32_13125 [Dehalococcoidia bacterium]|nr:hypothetical protein [Dehalococcoidia bacterium]